MNATFNQLFSVLSAGEFLYLECEEHISAHALKVRQIPKAFLFSEESAF